MGVTNSTCDRVLLELYKSGRLKNSGAFKSFFGLQEPSSMEAQFRPNCSSEEMIERARNDHRDALDIIQQYTRLPEKTLWELAGRRARCLQDSLQALVKALDDWDSQTRILALLLAKHHWPPLEQLTPICLRLACDDSVSRVRGVALDTLTNYYGWIDDPDGTLWKMIYADRRAGDAESLKSSSLVLSRAISERRERWRSMIGGLADQILFDRAIAESHLSNPNPEVRYVALCVMALEWKPTEHAAITAEGLLSQNIDEKMQVIALTVLGNYYEGTDDRRIGRLVAGIVADARRPLELRGTGYLALYKIKGIRPKTLPNAKAMLDETRFQDQVDWAFVASFDM
jgi:hypothetical protein